MVVEWLELPLLGVEGGKLSVKPEAIQVIVDGEDPHSCAMGVCGVMAVVALPRPKVLDMIAAHGLARLRSVN